MPIPQEHENINVGQKNSSPIEDSFDRLNKEIAVLAELVEQFSRRLHPVLGPYRDDESAKASPDVQPRPERSAITLSLEDALNDVANIRRRLIRLEERLEI